GEGVRVDRAAPVDLDVLVLDRLTRIVALPIDRGDLQVGGADVDDLDVLRSGRLQRERKVGGVAALHGAIVDADLHARERAGVELAAARGEAACDGKRRGEYDASTHDPFLHPSRTRDTNDRTGPTQR